MRLWDRQPASDVLREALQSYATAGGEAAIREAHRGTRERERTYILLRRKAEADPLATGPKVLAVLRGVYGQFGTEGWELYALSCSVRLMAEGLIPKPGKEGIAEGIVYHWRERAALVLGAGADVREEVVAIDARALRKLERAAPELFQRVLQETPYASQVLEENTQVGGEASVLPV